MFTNSRMTFAHCRDGASNVFVVGEQSNYLVDVNGMQQAWSASSYGGWSNGCDSFGTLPWTLWRSYNTNTIRYGINLTRNGWDGATAGVGSSHNDSPAGMPMNIPLNSSHPGVAGVLWADGAVGYLGETTSLDVLARLSTRDDAALVTGN